jgi:hypothetical protein
MVVDVRPIFECVAPEGDGNFSVFFSYENLSTSGGSPVAVTIPRGQGNRFTPATMMDRIPEVFTVPNVVPGHPGRTAPDVNSPKAFVIRGWNGTPQLNWRAGGYTATASTAKRCSGPAFTASGPSEVGIELVTPSALTTVRGFTDFQVRLAAGTVVSSVVFSIDGIVVGSRAVAPWYVNFDTSALDDGQHLFAVSILGSGNAEVLSDQFRFSSTNHPNFDQVLAQRLHDGLIRVDEWALTGVKQIVGAGDASFSAAVALLPKDEDDTPRLANYLGRWTDLSAATKAQINALFVNPGPAQALNLRAGSSQGRGAAVGDPECQRMRGGRTSPAYDQCDFRRPATSITLPGGRVAAVPAIHIGYKRVLRAGDYSGYGDKFVDKPENDVAGDFGSAGTNGTLDVIDQVATTALWAAAVYQANNYQLGVATIEIQIKDIGTGRAITLPTDNHTIWYPPQSDEFFTIRHEVFHIYQWTWGVSAGQYKTRDAGWWMEGTAKWADSVVIDELCGHLTAAGLPKGYGDRTCELDGPKSIHTDNPYDSIHKHLGDPWGRIDEKGDDDGLSKVRGYGMAPLVTWLSEQFSTPSPNVFLGPPLLDFVDDTFRKIGDGMTAVEAIDDTIRVRSTGRRYGRISTVHSLREAMPEYWTAMYEMSRPASADPLFPRDVQQLADNSRPLLPAPAEKRTAWQDRLNLYTSFRTDTGEQFDKAQAISGDLVAFGDPSPFSEVSRVARARKAVDTFVGAKAVFDETLENFGVGFVDIHASPNTVTEVVVSNAIDDRGKLAIDVRALRYAGFGQPAGHPDLCRIPAPATPGPPQDPNLADPVIQGTRRGNDIFLKFTSPRECSNATLQIVQISDPVPVEGFHRPFEKHKVTIETFSAPPKTRVRCRLDVFAAPEHVAATAFGTFRSSGAFESLACSMPVGYQIVGSAGPRGVPPTINVQYDNVATTTPSNVTMFGDSHVFMNTCADYRQNCWVASTNDPFTGQYRAEGYQGSEVSSVDEPFGPSFVYTGTYDAASWKVRLQKFSDGTQQVFDVELNLNIVGSGTFMQVYPPEGPSPVGHAFMPPT